MSKKYFLIRYYDGTHLNFFDGNADLEFLKKIIPKDATITLETPQNIDKQKKEIEFLRK